MTRRFFCKVLLIAFAVFGLLVLSGVLLAQGRSKEALEHAKAVQERHTDALMAKPGVVGTAVGLNDNGRHVVMVLLGKPGVAGIPDQLEDVPVHPVVSGKFYALPKPGGKPDGSPRSPRALTATAVGIDRIDLDWKDNREPDIVYNVYRSLTSGEPYDKIAPDVAVSNYSDNTVSAGTTYYYVVTAVDTSERESNYSNEASATTEGGTVGSPAAPTSLTATASSSSQIDLNWTDNANNETGFKIERDSVQIDTVGANVTSYSDSGLDPSTTYIYRVRAYNGEGDSAYSNEASATTEPPPEKPPRWYERPVPIGVSTGHPDITAGTIGCRVKDASGNVYAVSNNHVYAASNNASIGDNVLQPGTVDGGVDPDDKIGTLFAFEPIKFDGSDNTIDAAIASSTTSLLGNATPSGGYGTPSSVTAEAYIGQDVQKYGRTTGLTNGSIAGINATVDVNYGDGKVARFVNQIMIWPGSSFSAGGDSGSLIVTDDGNRNPVGLLFAGSLFYTIANPIDMVLSQFGVTVDGEGTTSPPPPTPEGSVSVDSITYSTIGGGRHLLITVALVDDLGGPVAGASVSILLIHTSQAWSGTETTGTDGTAAFRLSNAPPGCYMTMVTEVIAGELDWDPLDLDKNWSEEFCK